MICNDYACNCGIVSSTLTVTGSGALGDPYHLETNAFAVVTSSTRPAGFAGQHIYETDTKRDASFDGTNWVYINNLPEFQIESQATQSIANTPPVTPTLSVEVSDTDAFHTGTNGFVTIPAAKGGRYTIIASATWAADSTSYRFVRAVVSSNAGAPTQNGADRTGGYAMLATANNGFIATYSLLLAAGAVVTLNVGQATAGALDLLNCSLKGWMTRHIPSLV